ncbi:MAG: insulinase family protein [Prevotella sp.]|nr:insulinase family protein [Prevotella sp.]
MKKKYWLVYLPLCLFTFLLFSSCSKKYEKVKGDMTQTRIYTLKNGLKVYLSVNKEEPRIQTFIAVRTGSKNDPAETTGLAHYLEHLMFKGTDKFGVTDPEAEAPLLADIEERYEKYRLMTDPEERRQAYHGIDSVSQLAAQYFIPNEYDKLMSAIGAEGTNAFTSYDVTCYTEDIPSNEVENWARIQADRFKNMVIRGFHTELEAVYEEYNIHLSSDMDKVLNALLAKLFATHSYGTQTTIGTQEHLKNPSITNIKNYFKKWYVPNNVAICMAGDFDPDEVVAIIEKHFGDWKPGDDVQQPDFGEQPMLTAPADTTVVGQEQEMLWMAWRFDRASSLQADTLDVIDHMLNNGTAGLIDLDINQQMKMLQAGAGSEKLQDYSFFLMLGLPREGQTLDEVQQLLLDELDKLKKGDFSDDLLPSVVNNMKLEYYNSLESNRARASLFVDAFINGTPWEQEVKKLDRIGGITKEQIVDFANRHFTDGYACVRKLKGVDETQKKIDKPAITPIPSNRDLVSDFVKEIQATKPTPIKPVFVDFKKDLTFGKTGSLPYIYVQNKENGRFTLQMRYDFGEESDVRYNYAAEYLDYLGTDKLTPEQLKQQFYKLACTYNISVAPRSISVSLNGLGESMPEALGLLEDLMQNAKVDSTAWQQYIDITEKALNEAKSNQQQNFQQLVSYGIFGPYNQRRNILTPQQLRATDPQELLDLLKNLPQYEHTILYYGPLAEKELADVMADKHQVPAELKAVPEGKHYTMQPTPENEILIAPYDAKNIYMRMIHNEQRPWNAEEAPVQALFNEYYGGGMNTVVFQELRETRGLAYNAYAMYMQPQYQGEPEFFFTHIITQNDKMMDCVRQFNAILDTIPQSKAAFKVARKALRKRLQSQRTTKFGLINAWITAHDRGIDYDLNEVIYNALPNLTLEDIVKFEQEQMARKPYRYIILGDEKELDMKALQDIGPIRRLTTEEIFGY